jgi:hypothetical protein
VRVLEGTLGLASRPVAASMVPVARVFTLRADDVLTPQLVRRIAGTAHSRVPVCAPDNPTHVVGLLLVKLLLCLRGNGVGLTVGALPLLQPVELPPDATLLEALHAFERARAHMALVVAGAPPPSLAQGAPRDHPPRGTSGGGSSGGGGGYARAEDDGPSSSRQPDDDHPRELLGIICLEDCLAHVLNQQPPAAEAHRPPPHARHAPGRTAAETAHATTGSEAGRADAELIRDGGEGGPSRAAHARHSSGGSSESLPRESHLVSDAHEMRALMRALRGGTAAAGAPAAGSAYA